MLDYGLIHPPLIEALATAGHGDRILLADGNYPLLGMTHPQARLIHLNLAPGMLTVTDVLPVLLTAIRAESAVMMASPEPAPIQRECLDLLGPQVPVEHVDRYAFYDLARSQESGVVVATAEQRIYGNLLLTVGVG